MDLYGLSPGGRDTSGMERGKKETLSAGTLGMGNPYKEDTFFFFFF